MKKGLLYIGISSRIVVLCTGASVGASYPAFSGTVVENDDPFSSLKQGEHSSTWSAAAFEDFDKAVNLRSQAYIEMGDSC